MPEPVTPRLSLPMVQPAQAQKHVTVNEALSTVDGAVQLTLTSTTRTAPPEPVVEGQSYAVPFGATGVWAGQEGRVALGVNGGWVFLTPARGWTAFDLEANTTMMHSGSEWIVGALTMGVTGAGISARLFEQDVAITAGTSVATAMTLPAHAIVIGSGVRVLETVTGTATAWSLGVPGAGSRFGTGFALTAGSTGRGQMNAAFTFYNPTTVTIAAVGGSFAGAGKVRVALHLWELRLPG